MNPLEDNLTRRLKHKRNRSSIASESTWGFEDDDRKSARFSQSQGTNRRSDGAYEDFSRPPSIPFMHTRTGSSTTMGSHSSIPVGTSPRGSNIDLPPRNYQIPYAGSANASQRNSMVSLGNGSQSPPKRGSYAAVPQAGEQQWMASPERNARQNQNQPHRKSMPNIAGKSTRAAPLNGDTVIRRPKSNYGSRYGRYDSGNESDSDIALSNVSRITDPLASHPIATEAKAPLSPQRIPAPQRESALSQMTLNRMNTVATHSSSIYSTDEMGNPSQGDLSQLDKRSELRELTFSPKKMGRSYGELRNSGMGEVPQLVGRNVSTGNDLGLQKGYRREVSGAVAEEGRGGQGWGARFRKVSGLGQGQ